MAESSAGSRLAAGTLRLKGSLQSRTVTRDSGAATTNALQPYTTYTTWWFRILEQVGGEIMDADKVTAVSEYHLEGRYQSATVPTDQLVWGSKTLRITHIENMDGMGEAMRLRAVERLN